MKMVISPTNRVRVTRIIKGYERGYYVGTVIGWIDRGKLKIKADTGMIAIVSSELVRKVADGQKR